MHTELPGGAWVDGRVVRRAKLRPMTGQLEHTLLECLAEAQSWPQAVSTVVALALDSVGSELGSLQLAERLAVADRQFLLLRLATLLHGDDFWASAACQRCGAWFDLGLKRSHLPIKRAGAGYPFVNVSCGQRTLGLRVPVGADQHDLLGLQGDVAERRLLQSCLVSVDGQPAPADFVAGLGVEELRHAEQALDDMAPDVGTRVQTRCPECAAEQVVEVDPYGLLAGGGEDLYREVHIIAGRYHWSEPEILALPRERRRFYLGLIDQERGLYS